MDNSSTMSETETTNNIINESAIKPNPQGNSPRKGFKLLIVVLSILVVFLTTILGYLFMTGRVNIDILDRKDDEQVQEENNGQDDGDENENEEEGAEVIEYTEYYNENFGVKLNYPQDWVIIEESEDGDMAFTLKIGESANAQEDVFLFQIMSSEIDKCIYSEEDLTVSDGPTYEVLYDNYVEIGTEEIYRRSFAKYGEYDSYIVCQKGEDDIFRKGNPAFITYWNFDETNEDVEEKLEILDNILLSYEYSGE